jgi:hypothetical protein
MIGGNFNSVSGVAKHRVARIKLCTNSSTWDGTNWKNGLPSSDKTIVFTDNSLILQPVLVLVNFLKEETVTVPAGNSLSLIFFTRVWEP